MSMNMSATPSRRRTSFSLDEKRRVLEHLRGSGHVRETIERFYPQLPPESYDARRRLVLNWRRNAQKILAGATTRQGAARKRMRKPKNQKPQPPMPRGLAETQSTPFLDENEQEMDEFEPIELRRNRTTRTEVQNHQGGDQQGEMLLQNRIQDQQMQARNREGGIQDLIASSVEQITKRQEPLAGQADIETDPDSGRDQDEMEEGYNDSDENSEERLEIEATATQQATKRCSFSLDEKRRVLEHLAACKNVRETIERFYPDLPPEDFKTRRRAIWKWRKCREQIVAGCADDKASARKKMRPHGIVCQRGPRHVEPQDVVGRLLTSVKKSEQRALKRKGNRVLRPAPSTGPVLAERQVDALVFSALGLPPTTQFSLIQPAPSSITDTAVTAAGTSTMRPLEHGEATFAIRRR